MERLSGHPVEIRPASVPEPTESITEVRPDAPAPSPLDQVRRLGDELASAVDGLRAACPPMDRSTRWSWRARGSARHRAATEQLVYPLVDRLDPDDGADIVWYPAHHEQRTQRLLDRLEAGAPLSPWLADDLCAEVHVLLDELEVRVLPLLDAHLRDDPSARFVVQRDIESVLARG